MDSIDFNCDLGEGQSNDTALMPYITSCNVSCGFHAGAPHVIRKTIENAIYHDVKIGAHPSYDDRDNLGRISQQVSVQMVYDIVLYQVSALYTMTMSLGDSLHHVKLHGALYNDTARDVGICEWAYRAISDVDADLYVYGLPGTAHQAVAEKLGLTFVPEAFADRAYMDDGTLVPRSEKNAVLSDPAVISSQVFGLAAHGKVVTSSGKDLLVSADTICFHGDNAGVLEYLRVCYDHLIKNGINVCAVNEL